MLCCRQNTPLAALEKLCWVTPCSNDLSLAKAAPFTATLRAAGQGEDPSRGGSALLLMGCCRLSLPGGSTCLGSRRCWGLPRKALRLCITAFPLQQGFAGHLLQHLPARGRCSPMQRCRSGSLAAGRLQLADVQCVVRSCLWLGPERLTA